MNLPKKGKIMFFFVQGFCNFLAILIFGIYADAIPGKWMPRADYTFLSWSYLFTLGAMVASFFSGKIIL